MPNQIHSKNKPAVYDAGDMYDLAALAENDMQWMQIAIDETKSKVSKVKEDLAETYPNASYYFRDLEKLLEIYSYLAESRCIHHEKEAKTYKELWEAQQGIA